MDYYTQDPARLEGQPKKTIADYVGSCGIHVPRRFETLKEARKSRKALFLRSEHPQDYDGVSGLLRSFRLSGKHPFPARGIGTLREVKEKYFRSKDRNDSISDFCDFLGVPQDQFRRDTSFSVWEYVPGVFRIVYADSAIQGKHHILSWTRGGQFAPHSYRICDNGRFETLYTWEMPRNDDDLLRLIYTYEQVRHLPRFDSGHCPIMEFVTAGDKDFFLQYHRARDFEPAAFTLERSPEKGELEAFLVRGATPPEGVDVDMTISRKGFMQSLSGREFLPEEEDSSFSLQEGVYGELMFRKRKFQPVFSPLMAAPDDPSWTYQKIARTHYKVSSMFKPLVSAVIDVRRLIPGAERNRFMKEAMRTGERQSLMFRVVSDGRRAFLSRA